MNGKEEVWDQVEAFRRKFLVGELAHRREVARDGAEELAEGVLDAHRGRR